MNPMRLWRRIGYFLRRRREAAELAAEMEFHRAMLRSDAPGSTRRMGSELRAHEDARSIWIAWWMETLLQDLEYGFRALIRQPGFTATALLALVLGIGLNTSLFTVFNAIALRPWPVRDPARLVSLFTVRGEAEHRRVNYDAFSVPEYRYLAARAHTLTGMVADWDQTVTLDRRPGGPRAICDFVSANYFPVLGVDMALGRGFLAEEDRPGAPSAVAVLPYRAWKTRYAGADDIVGRQIRVEESLFTVVGVAQEEFPGARTRGADLWIPLSSLVLVFPNVPMYRSVLFDGHFIGADVAGRLAPGVTREQAAAELTNLSAGFEKQPGEKPYRIAAVGTELIARPDPERKVTLSVVALLFSAVLAILLVACANVSNLLLARGAARRSEIAVRVSLGAGQSRIVRQLLTESLLLAGIAAALGVAVAWFLPTFIVRQFIEVPAAVRLVPDEMVLAWSAGLACLSALAFGLAPALNVTGSGVSEAMKHHARAATSRFRLRSLLLATQVTVSVVLLIIAGLMTRGLAAVQSHDPGFRIAGVTMATVDLPVNQYTGTRGGEIAASLEERLTAIAQGGKVAFAIYPPLSPINTMASFRSGSVSDIVLRQFVNGAYFDVLSISILQGRNFVRDDSARNVLIVNEAAARRYWPNDNPIGKNVEIRNTSYQVVGVSHDAEISALGPVRPIFFFPFQGGSGITILVRGDSEKWAPTLSQIVTAAEPRASLDAGPLSAQVDKTLRPARIATRLSTALGLLALLLASVGVYGVISYSVEQRRRELGVRMALGARPSEIVVFVLKDNLKPMVGGLAVGLFVSVAAARLLHGLVYGLPQYDPVAYFTVLAILLAAGAIASVVPARRSARINPVEALRYE